METRVVCPGCGAEIDPETGTATYDGRPVEGDEALRQRVEELEKANAELHERLAVADRAVETGTDDDDNPFFH